MRKRLLTTGLAVLMAASITACGGKPDTKEKSEKITESTKKATEKSTEKTEADELAALSGTPLTDAMKTIKKLGYKATYYADGEDFTDFIDDLKDDYTTGDLKINEDAKTVDITLVLTSNIKADKEQKELAKKLNIGTAWNTAEKYGRKKYGKDFDLKYLTGKIAENADNKNTWFLKAECTLNGEKKTCEAKITGSTDNPKIKSFDVY